MLILVVKDETKQTAELIIKLLQGLSNNDHSAHQPPLEIINFSAPIIPLKLSEQEEIPKRTGQQFCPPPKNSRRQTAKDGQLFMRRPNLRQMMRSKGGARR